MSITTLCFIGPRLSGKTSVACRLAYGLMQGGRAAEKYDRFVVKTEVKGQMVTAMIYDVNGHDFGELGKQDFVQMVDSFVCILDASLAQNKENQTQYERLCAQLNKNALVQFVYNKVDLVEAAPAAGRLFCSAETNFGIQQTFELVIFNALQHQSEARALRAIPEKLQESDGGEEGEEELEAEEEVTVKQASEQVVGRVKALEERWDTRMDAVEGRLGAMEQKLDALAALVEGGIKQVMGILSALEFDVAE